MPAMAAEPQEYVFEIMPPMSLLDDFNFNTDGELSAFYEGPIPEGLYNVYIYEDDSLILASLSPISVKYSWSQIDGVDFLTSCSTVPYSDGMSYNSYVVDALDYYGLTLFELGTPNYVGVYVGTSVKFVSVKETTLPAGKFADLINADTLATSFDCLISLLPVVLAVIVGYIGLRKAIAWLMSVMRSS